MSIKDYSPCTLSKKLQETFTNIETLYEKNSGRVSSLEFTNTCILYVEEVNYHLTSLANTLYNNKKTSHLITYYLDDFKVPSSGFLPASKFIDVIYTATEENSKQSFVDYNLKCQQGHAFNEKTMDKKTVALMENNVCEKCEIPVYHDIIVRLLSRTEYPSDDTETTKRIGKVALNDKGVFDEKSLPKVMAELTGKVTSLFKSSVPVIISSKATQMYKKGIEEGKPKNMLDCYKQVSFLKVMKEVERAMLSSLKSSIENMEWNKKAAVAPFVTEKVEDGSNDVEMRNEEKDDVKEVVVPPSQKKANRGVANFLASRRTNPLSVRMKRKHYQDHKTEWQLIDIRSKFDNVHADTKVYKSDTRYKREHFPIDLNTVGVCSEDAYSQSTDEHHMACRHAVVSAIRPWLASDEKMMRTYDFCSIKDPREVSRMDRCDPEEILSKNANGKYVRTNGKYANIKKCTNFEMFVMNAVEKAIVPYASREELMQHLVKATSGVGSVEAIVERSCGMNKLTSRDVVNPERNVLERLDKLAVRNNETVFLNNIAFVDTYIKYLRGKRGEFSLKGEDLARLEKAFEGFARSQEEKDKEYCHLDYIVARGIDPTFPLVHMMFTLFFNNYVSASYNLPVLPMSVYDEISQAVKVMGVERPDAWKEEYLQNREDLALDVFRFGLQRHGFLVKGSFVQPFFITPVKPEDAIHGVDEENMTVKSSPVDPKVETVKRRRREEASRRGAVNIVSPPHLPPSLVTTMEEKIKEDEDSDIKFISKMDGDDMIVMDTIELEKEKNEMDERKKIELLKKTIERNMGGNLLERFCKADLEKTTKDVTEFCESDGEAEKELRGESTTFKKIKSEITRAKVEYVINKEIRKMDKGRLNVFSQLSVPSVLLCGKVKEPSVLSVPKDIRDQLERKKEEAKKKRQQREAKRRIEEEVANDTNNKNISIDTPGGRIEVIIGGRVPAVEKREEKDVTASIEKEKKKNSEVADKKKDKKNSAAEAKISLPAPDTESNKEEESLSAKNREVGMEEQQQQEGDTGVSGTVMNAGMETKENETMYYDQEETEKSVNSLLVENLPPVIEGVPDIDFEFELDLLNDQPIDGQQQQLCYYGTDSTMLETEVGTVQNAQQSTTPEDGQQITTQKTAQVPSLSPKRNLEHEEEEEDAPVADKKRDKKNSAAEAKISLPAPDTESNKEEESLSAKNREVGMEEQQQQEGDTGVSGTVMNAGMETKENETMYYDQEETEKSVNSLLVENLPPVIEGVPDIDFELVLDFLKDQAIDGQQQQLCYYGTDSTMLETEVGTVQNAQQSMTPEDGQQIITQKTAQVPSLSPKRNLEHEEEEEDAPAMFTQPSLTKRQRVSSSSSSTSSNKDSLSSSVYCNETEAEKKKRRRRKEKERRRRRELNLLTSLAEEEEDDEKKNVSEKEMKRQHMGRKEKKLLKILMGQDITYAPLEESLVVYPPAPRLPAKKDSLFYVAGIDYIGTESD
nr:MAG: hypothetical protein [Hemigrapsus takanoi nimavirus]